jgi:uncharacterized delta-60 repeat protein
MSARRSWRVIAIAAAVFAGPLALSNPPVAAIDRVWTDPTFAGGPLVVDVGATQAYANAVTVQRDGRVVVVGTAVREGHAVIVVLRFLADGRPDPGFGAAGQVFFGGEGSRNDGNGVAVQPDGKIVVAGSMRGRWDGEDQMAVARLQPDGKLDTTFAGGIVSIEGRTMFSTGVAMALRPDGRIILGGYGTPTDYASPGAISRSRDFMVARVLPDGTLDPAFGQNGVTLSTFHGNPESSDVASAMVVARTAGSCWVATAPEISG